MGAFLLDKIDMPKEKLAALRLNELWRMFVRTRFNSAH